jgi:hypothetical protein
MNFAFCGIVPHHTTQLGFILTLVACGRMTPHDTKFMLRVNRPLPKASRRGSLEGHAVIEQISIEMNTNVGLQKFVRLGAIFQPRKTLYKTCPARKYQ